MTEPTTFDPYECSRCKTRLQWVITYDATVLDEEGRPKSRLSIIEFDTSQAHACVRKVTRSLPPYVASPYEKPLPDLTRAVESFERVQHQLLSAHEKLLSEVRILADDAKETLASADSALKTVRGMAARPPTQPPPQRPPEPPQQDRRGSLQI